jgi:hypothetical protein
MFGQYEPKHGFAIAENPPGGLRIRYNVAALVRIGRERSDQTDDGILPRLTMRMM